MESKLYEKHTRGNVTSKINMIKEIRELTGFGLKEAKTIADKICAENEMTDVIKRLTCQGDCLICSSRIFCGGLKGAIRTYLSRPF